MPKTPRQLRSQLDSDLAPLRELDLKRPSYGWLSTIRSAMELPAGLLATWLRATQQNVSDMERREREGSITLATLQRAADALDCRLVYALVPNRPIEQSLATLARKVAESIENLTDEEREDLLEDLKRHPAKMWRMGS